MGGLLGGGLLRCVLTKILDPRQNSSDPVSCGLRELIRPLVHGLNRPIAHGHRSFFGRAAKKFDCGFLFHGMHCKHIYKMQ